jgi:hypothetical protein
MSMQVQPYLFFEGLAHIDHHFGSIRKTVGR